MEIDEVVEGERELRLTGSGGRGGSGDDRTDASTSAKKAPGEDDRRRI